MAMAFAPESEGRSRTLAMVHGEVVGDAQVPPPQCRSRRRYSRARCHKEADIRVIQSERRLSYTPTLSAILERHEQEITLKCGAITFL